MPTTGNALGHAIRDPELEAQVLKLTQQMGIGAQLGGKYFCHDVRVIRLPRHGASCPVGIGVSCSADRQALGKITADGVFLEQLETDPAHYLPEPTGIADDAVHIDLNRPMSEMRAARFLDRLQSDQPLPMVMLAKGYRKIQGGTKQPNPKGAACGTLRARESRRRPCPTP